MQLRRGSAAYTNSQARRDDPARLGRADQRHEPLEVFVVHVLGDELGDMADFKVLQLEGLGPRPDPSPLLPRLRPRSQRQRGSDTDGPLSRALIARSEGPTAVRSDETNPMAVQPARRRRLLVAQTCSQKGGSVPILTDTKPRPWQIPDGVKSKIAPAGYFLGGGTTPLEVALAAAPTRPTEADIRSVWKKRKGNTPSPLLLIVKWPDSGRERASVCGPTGDNPPVYSDRDVAQVERIASSDRRHLSHRRRSRSLRGGT